MVVELKAPFSKNLSKRLALASFLVESCYNSINGGAIGNYHAKA